MNFTGQVAILFAVSAMALFADEGNKFGWKAPDVGAGIFTDELGLFDRERDEYADSIAIYAINKIVETKASRESLAEARKLLGLALHLSPRNKHALVTNFQLSRDILPRAIPNSYSPEVLSGLLSVRAEALMKQGGAQNKLLARAFIELAADMDPENIDLVYASELQRLDHGKVDWSVFTDQPDKKEDKDPE